MVFSKKITGGTCTISNLMMDLIVTSDDYDLRGAEIVLSLINVQLEHSVYSLYAVELMEPTEIRVYKW